MVGRGNVGVSWHLIPNNFPTSTFIVAVVDLDRKHCLSPLKLWLSVTREIKIPKGARSTSTYTSWFHVYFWNLFPWSVMASTYNLFNCRSFNLFEGFHLKQLPKEFCILGSWIATPCENYYCKTLLDGGWWNVVLPTSDRKKWTSNAFTSDTGGSL